MTSQFARQSDRSFAKTEIDYYESNNNKNI